MVKKDNNLNYIKAINIIFKNMKKRYCVQYAPGVDLKD